MQDPEQAVRLLSSARTSTGRVRRNNEDRIHLSTAGDALLAIIADGMGGAAAGEEASRIAIEAIERGMANALEADARAADFDNDHFANTMTRIVHSANTQIIQCAESQPGFKGMGTTLTLALVRSNELMLAHIGDSRAYLIDGHDGHIQQITSDHSFVQALLDAGHITADEAENHPMRNVLYRALGQADDVKVDLIQNLFLNTQDRIILCSDGLTAHVRPQEIAAAAMAHKDPEIISKQLVDLANERGGQDNISVIVIVVDGPINEQAAEYPRFEDDDDDATLPMGDMMIINPQDEPPISFSDSGRFSLSGGTPPEDDDTFQQPQ